jgi:hypothetical protein
MAGPCRDAGRIAVAGEHGRQVLALPPAAFQRASAPPLPCAGKEAGGAGECPGFHPRPVQCSQAPVS